MKQGIDVVKTYPWSDREHVSRRIDVRLGLIQPEIIESVRLYVPVADLLPEPLRRIRIRCIEVRSDGFLGPSRIRSSVRLMDQPSVLLQQVVELTGMRKMRPHAQQGIHAHRMQLTIHSCRIRPTRWLEIEFSLLRHVQEVHDDSIQRQLLFTILLRHIQNLFLGWIY